MQSARVVDTSSQSTRRHHPVEKSHTGSHHHAPRMAVLSLLGIVVGIIGGLVAEGLLRTINFFSNLCFYGKASDAYLPLNLAPHHWWFMLLPAAGGLVVGILIHYFSPEIKGDGIPAAMSVALNN